MNLFFGACLLLYGARGHAIPLQPSTGFQLNPEAKDPSLDTDDFKINLAVQGKELYFPNNDPQSRDADPKEELKLDIQQLEGESFKLQPLLPTDQQSEGEADRITEEPGAGMSDEGEGTSDDQKETALNDQINIQLITRNEMGSTDAEKKQVDRDYKTDLPQVTASFETASPKSALDNGKDDLAEDCAQTQEGALEEGNTNENLLDLAKALLDIPEITEPNSLLPNAQQRDTAHLLQIPLLLSKLFPQMKPVSKREPIRRSSPFNLIQTLFPSMFRRMAFPRAKENGESPLAMLSGWPGLGMFSHPGRGFSVDGFDKPVEVNKKEAPNSHEEFSLPGLELSLEMHSPESLSPDSGSDLDGPIQKPSFSFNNLLSDVLPNVFGNQMKRFASKEQPNNPHPMFNSFLGGDGPMHFEFGADNSPNKPSLSSENESPVNLEIDFGNPHEKRSMSSQEFVNHGPLQLEFGVGSPSKEASLSSHEFGRHGPIQLEFDVSSPSKDTRMPRQEFEKHSPVQLEIGVGKLPQEASLSSHEFWRHGPMLQFGMEPSLSGLQLAVGDGPQSVDISPERKDDTRNNKHALSEDAASVPKSFSHRDFFWLGNERAPSSKASRESPASLFQSLFSSRKGDHSKKAQKTAMMGGMNAVPFPFAISRSVKSPLTEENNAEDLEKLDVSQSKVSDPIKKQMEKQPERSDQPAVAETQNVPTPSDSKLRKVRDVSENVQDVSEKAQDVPEKEKDFVRKVKSVWEKAENGFKSGWSTVEKSDAWNEIKDFFG